jgi:hypothetical protein
MQVIMDGSRGRFFRFSRLTEAFFGGILPPSALLGIFGMPLGRLRL